MISDNSLGNTIRELRKEKNLTQEELADGVCSVVSMSRIENGVQMPSAKVLEKLLDKLGSSIYGLCRVYHDNSILSQKTKELERILDEFQSGRISSVEDEIQKLEIDNGDVECKRLVEFTKIVAVFYKGEADDKLKNTLIDIIKYTINDFDISKIDEYLLNQIDINALILLAAIYYAMGDIDTAIDISNRLYENLDKQESNLKSRIVSKINILFNLTQYFEAKKDYTGAYKYIELLEKEMLKSGEYILQVETMYIKAKTLNKMGENTKAKEILKASSPYARLIGKEKIADSMDELYENIE